MLKMFELIMRLLFLIYWRIDIYKTEKEAKVIHDHIFDEYNDFMRNVEFSKKG